MISPERAADLQRSVVAKTGEEAGVRDPEVLLKVLSRPLVADRGVPRYPTLFNKVAALIIGVVQEQPFVAANRRTAWAMATLILDEAGYTLEADESEIDQMMKGVEMRFTTWNRLTVWIKRHVQRRSPRGEQ